MKQCDAQRNQTVLSNQSVQNYLTPAAEKFHIEVYDTITSTNTVLKERAMAGEPENTVIIARQQTAGRGRLGRKFYSPADTGLYMSLLLRPDMPMEDALFLTTAAAVAVTNAIEAVSGKETAIKWVNDIFGEGKKVCGILTEAAPNLENGKLEYAILGIGVNLLPPKEGFPKELQQVATSILKQDAVNDVQSRLAAEILNQLALSFTHSQQQEILNVYRQKCFLIGKEVQILPHTEAEQGEKALVLGIDDKVGLVVQLQDGTQKTLRTGEVSVRMTEKDGCI